MKSYITAFTILLALTLLPIIATAQSANDFDRDIRIAEGIIEELFRTEQAPGRQLRSRLVRDISGSYIPGYGIHFRISASISPAVVSLIIEKQTEIHINEGAETTEDKLQDLTVEFVVEQFLDYLKNYAVLFDNLPDDEIISLSIGTRNYAEAPFLIRLGSEDASRTIANLTAWAKASDIRAYNDQSISEEEFENRVDIVDLGELEIKQDQKVFASILQTSLDGITDSVQVRRQPIVEYLPGVGLNYYVSAQLRGSSLFNFGNIQVEGFKLETDSLSIDFSNALDNIDFSGISEIAERVDSIMASRSGETADNIEESVSGLRSSIESRRESLSDSDVDNLVDQIHESLQETIMTYGPTLKSLDDDELLIITVSWIGRHNALPERTVFRIRKSDLISGNTPNVDVVGS